MMKKRIILNKENKNALAFFQKRLIVFCFSFISFIIFSQEGAITISGSIVVSGIDHVHVIPQNKIVSDVALNTDQIHLFGDAQIKSDDFSLEAKSSKPKATDKKGGLIAKKDFKNEKEQERERKEKKILKKVPPQKVKFTIHIPDSKGNFSLNGKSNSKDYVLPSNSHLRDLTLQEIQFEIKKLEEIYFNTNFYYLSNLDLLKFSQVFSVRPPPLKAM